MRNQLSQHTLKSYKPYENNRTNHTSSPVQNTILHPFAIIGYPDDVVAKSTTSRRKLNNLTKANISTPFNRAFFIRSLRTSKISPAMDLFSMVGRKGQSLAVGCFPLLAVFLPLYVLPPVVGKLAVVFRNTNKGLSRMIYQFIGISRQHYDKTKAEQIRILAENETQARALKAREYVLIPVGRLPDTAFNAQTFNALEVANV